jgi:membrane-associated PAP2 superfamily phosphatase
MTSASSVMSEPESTHRFWMTNKRIAWVCIMAGVATGLILGLWSFDGPVPVPAWLGEYGDTPRRLARLGHIACFGIGFLNLHLVRTLEGKRLITGRLRGAARFVNFGNVFLPVALFAAAAIPACKYLLPIPALAVAAGVFLVAFDLARDRS